MNSPMGCPHCDHPMARLTAGRTKVRTSIVVLHKSGEVEVNCENCKRGVVLGKITEVNLSKSEHVVPPSPRLIVRRT